jgi:hypothetical protein
MQVVIERGAISEAGSRILAPFISATPCCHVSFAIEAI